MSLGCLTPRAVILSAFMCGCSWTSTSDDDKLTSPVTATKGVDPWLTFETKCFGPPNASQNVIFLEGISLADASPKESALEKAMAELALAAPARIAFPRSNIHCRGSKGKYCWGSDDEVSIKSTYETVVRSAKRCFDRPRPFGVIGFSNGGYHITRVAMHCLSPQPQWVVAIGSAGDIAHAADRDLAHCAPVNFMIGDEDITKPQARSLAAQLAARNARVRFEVFAGGHEVPFGRLAEFLRTRISEPTPNH